MPPVSSPNSLHVKTSHMAMSGPVHRHRISNGPVAWHEGAVVALRQLPNKTHGGATHRAGHGRHLNTGNGAALQHNRRYVNAWHKGTVVAIQQLATCTTLQSTRVQMCQASQRYKHGVLVSNHLAPIAGALSALAKLGPGQATCSGWRLCCRVLCMRTR